MNGDEIVPLFVSSSAHDMVWDPSPVMISRQARRSEKHSDVQQYGCDRVLIHR